jgi:hypothetical protein
MRKPLTMHYTLLLLPELAAEQRIWAEALEMFLLSLKKSEIAAKRRQVSWRIELKIVRTVTVLRLFSKWSGDATYGAVLEEIAAVAKRSSQLTSRVDPRRRRTTAFDIRSLSLAFCHGAFPP